MKTSWTDPACRNGKDSCCQVRLEEERTPWKSYDPTQDLIFPPELKVNHDKYHSGPLKFESKVLKWFRPVTLTQLLQLKHSYPEGKIVVGNTELGVEMKFKDAKYPVMIQPSHVRIYQYKLKRKCIALTFPF